MPPLTNTAGQQTNAVYGFTTMLLRLIEEHKPSHLIVAFDAGKITFRHEGYEDYKGGRQKTPPELSEQFPLLKDLLRHLGVPQFEISGYEADDIIGSISREADAAGREVMIVSGDKDMLQLASEHTTIALVRKGVTEVEMYGPEQIREKYDLTPEQIIDLKGLMGDASDNIPGVPGVGEKTALKLLHQFGSVEGVLAGTGELKGKMKKLEEHADSAVMSKKLATIYREVPLEHAWEDMSFTGINRDTAGPALAKLEFKSLLERLSLSAHSGAADEVAAVEAAELDITIAGEADLEALIAALPGISALHVETSGENPHRSEVIGLGLSSPERHYFVPFALLQSPAAAPLRDWLGDSDAPKSGYDLHRADLALHWQGIAFAGAANDVQLAAYLLDPTEANQNLNDLTSKYGLPRLSPDEEVFGKGAKYKIPELEILGNHVARKSATVLGIVEKQQQELKETAMTGLFEDLEMPLSRILADMEKQGIAVNKTELKELGKEFEAQIAALVAEIYEICGTEFNLNSPKQLGEILFVKLGLPVDKRRRPGTQRVQMCLRNWLLIMM